mgnify:CR=1 FL=1
MSQSKLITMDEFTIQETRKFPQATGELSSLLRDLGLAGKIINKQVRKAGRLKRNAPGTNAGRQDD